MAYTFNTQLDAATNVIKLIQAQNDAGITAAPYTGSEPVDYLLAQAVVNAASQSEQDPAIETVVRYSPATDTVVSFAANDSDQTIFLTPAGTLANLTISLPVEAVSRIGQVVRFGSSKALTNLVINGASVVLAGQTTLAANGTGTYQKVMANTWIRLT